jgi:hypothetical protein
MNKNNQFHANPEIFFDPYLNTPKKYLSSLATCPNKPLSGCNPIQNPQQVINYSADAFHGAAGSRSIQLAPSPIVMNENFQNGKGGYVTVGDQQFDTTGIIAPRSWHEPVVSPIGTDWLGTRHYANPTLAQMGGQIQWLPAAHDKRHSGGHGHDKHHSGGHGHGKRHSA